MADSGCRMQIELNTCSNCLNIPVLQEIGVAESNGVVRIAAEISVMAVSAHA